MIFELTNGNYIVSSPLWNDGAISEVGAATWASGSTGVTGSVSAINSLIGSSPGDRLASGDGNSDRIIPLTNGNYLVASIEWDNGAGMNAGAVTWGNGATGTNGAVSPLNSLVGTLTDTNVGFRAVPLANGDYVLGKPVLRRSGCDQCRCRNVGRRGERELGRH